MSGPTPHVEWYLARDGQQFGPISDVELRKLIELDHLKSTDLIWRDGFPEWRSADILIKQRPAPVPRQPAPMPAHGVDARPMAQRPVANAQPQQQPQARPQQPAHQLQPREAQAREAQAREAQPRVVTGAPQRLNPDTATRTQPEWSQPAPRTPLQAPAPHGTAPRATARERGSEYRDDESVGRSIGRRIGRVGAIAFILALLAGAGWAIWNFVPLGKAYQVASAVVPGVAAPVGAIEAAPLGGFGNSAASIDQTLQKSDLWRLLKRDFPDWYQARLQESVEAALAGKGDTVITEQMAKALVVLRRQNAEHALSAGIPRLKALAGTFARTLTKLNNVSVDACYGFISRGEASPEIVKLMQSPQHTALVQGMLLAVFEAIAEGRRTPRVYPPPRQTDYSALTAELTLRGWTPADMQLFSDERMLAKAPPDRVCQMVQQWFEAQLGMKDADAQLRLLVDALKPVVAG